MRMPLVVRDTHGPLGRGVDRISSGIDGGLGVFVLSVIRSSTLYQHAGMPLYRESNSSRVQGGWVLLQLARPLIPVHVMDFPSGLSMWAM